MCFARDGGKQITFNLKTLIGVGVKLISISRVKQIQFYPPPL